MAAPNGGERKRMLPEVVNASPQPKFWVGPVRFAVETQSFWPSVDVFPRGTPHRKYGVCFLPKEAGDERSWIGFSYLHAERFADLLWLVHEANRGNAPPEACLDWVRDNLEMFPDAFRYEFGRVAGE